MQPIEFDEVVQRITQANPRYHRDAYFFVREGLDHAQRRVTKNGKELPRHVTAHELLDGLRHYGLEQYGPMTITVLAEWGVTQCEDLGEIVFQMIEAQLFSKTETDQRKDFKGGYKFHDAFCEPFLPRKPATSEEPTAPESARV